MVSIVTGGQNMISIMTFPSKDFILPCIPRDDLKKIHPEFTEELITKIAIHMQRRRITGEMFDVYVSLAIRENLFAIQENQDDEFSKNIELSKDDFSKIHQIFKKAFTECTTKIPIQ